MDVNLSDLRAHDSILWMYPSLSDRSSTERH